MKRAFSFEEAAEATGYSIDTIRRAVRNSELTARYANTKPVILAGELDEWLAALPTEAPKR
jgi:hypothetical protein